MYQTSRYMKKNKNTLFILAYSWAYAELEFSVALQYVIWVIFPLVFICFSTGFVHLVGPNAIGKQNNQTLTAIK